MIGDLLHPDSSPAGSRRGQYARARFLVCLACLLPTLLVAAPPTVHARSSRPVGGFSPAEPPRGTPGKDSSQVRPPESSPDVDEQRKRLAAHIADLLRLEKEGKPTEELEKQVNALIERLLPKDPTDVYGRRFDELLLAVVREHHPELIREVEQKIRAKNLAATRWALQSIRQALDHFNLDTALYPTTEQGLAVLSEDRGRGPYITRSFPIKDPWGHPFVYRFPSLAGRKPYDLFSVGPDGKEGTADDIE